MAIYDLFDDIADAIKEKDTSVTSITPANMPDAIRGISGGVELLTRAEWENLTTEEKQAKELVAIQYADSGFDRGELVYGGDYVDAPSIVDAQYMSGQSGTAISSTITDTYSRYTILVVLVAGNVVGKPLSNVNITLNDTNINEEFTYIGGDTAAGSTCAAEIYGYTTALTAGDIVQVERAASQSNSGIQLFVLKNATTNNITFVESVPNGSSNITITGNDSYYLICTKFGYYSGRNTIPTTSIEYVAQDDTYTVEATGSDTAYWYGGSYVIQLTS